MKTYYNLKETGSPANSFAVVCDMEGFELAVFEHLGAATLPDFVFPETGRTITINVEGNLIEIERTWVYL